MLRAVIRSTRRRLLARFTPFALLGALTFAPACKGDDPGKDASKDAGKDAGEDPKPEGQTPGTPPVVAPPAGPTSNPVDSPVVVERGEVVATVQFPSGTKMSDVAAAIDAIQPGASMMLGMQIPAALKGAVGFEVDKTAKLDAPISVLLLDPSSHPEPVALLLTPKDEAGLSAAAKGAGHEVELRNGLALIGPAGVVTAAKEFAFGHLSQYPDHTEIIVYPQRLLSSYAGSIDGALAGIGAAMAGLDGGNEAMTQMLRSYAEAGIALAKQTDRIVMSVGSSPAGADLITRIYPIPGTTLASFIEAQIASDHALLAKLPSGGGNMVMTGDMRAGPARDAFVDFTVGVMAPMYGGMPAEEWVALMTPWLDALDGRFAMSMRMDVAPGAPPAMAMTALMGVDDSAKLLGSWRAMLSKMATGPGLEMMGMKITGRHEQNVLEHDGVEVDLYASNIDTSGMPADQAAAMAAAQSSNQAMHLAAFDNLAVMATADDGGKSIKATIDSARGKGETMTPSPSLAAALAAGKTRGDSMLMFFDISQLAENAGTPAPQTPFSAIGFSVGKFEGALSVRVSLLK
jgi:hypothetical protein